MTITWRRALGLSAALTAFAGLVQMAGCTTDEGDPGDGSGGSSANTGGSAGAATGSGGANTGGSGGGTNTGGSSQVGGTLCPNPIVLPSASPGIADFEDYDGVAALATWSFALGGDSSTGLFSGPFGYGDEPDGFPELFEMVAGDGSTYALSISDTLAEEYGGGMGLWLSDCLDATAFSGISFWVRGNAPTGSAVLSLLMAETSPAVPEVTGDKYGTCSGANDVCTAPTYSFTVTDTWTQIEVPWASFVPGSTPEGQVPADGHNIWQIQFDIGVVWEPGDAGYVPVPAPYELVIDDLTFY